MTIISSRLLNLHHKDIYVSKLVDAGYLTNQEVKDVLQEFDDLDNEQGATIFRSTMRGVNALKI